MYLQSFVMNFELIFLICFFLVDRNVADFFKQYIEALGGTRGSSAFYRRPLHGYPIRYGEQPIGINKLNNFMKIICERGGLKGNYNNHSGKRICATQLYMAGFDEREIMARTGHRSEKSVRKYTQSSTKIQQKVRSVLDPPNTTCSLKRDRAFNDVENCVGTCECKKMKVRISDEMHKTSYTGYYEKYPKTVRFLAIATFRSTAEPKDLLCAVFFVFV